MTSSARTIRLFVASPGDTVVERRALSDVVQDVNLALSQLAPGRATLQLLRWEDDVVGSFGRPQSLITNQIGDYDVLVAMMWRRFGTPTGRAGSGTEEEIRDAYNRWRRTGRPDVLLYFSLGEAPPPASAEESQQQTKVLEFKEFAESVGLVKTYANADAFPSVVRRDLFLLLGRLLQGADAPIAAAMQLIEGPTVEDGPEPDARIRALATEYLAIRDRMPSGDERTRQMEIIVSRMRALATDCYPNLETLLSSPSAGERLAGAAFLQVLPHPGELGWLSDRFDPTSNEKPFLQYHAAVALLAAANTLRQTHGAEVNAAVQHVLSLVPQLAPDTDRRGILTEAARVLGVSRAV